MLRPQTSAHGENDRWPSSRRDFLIVDTRAARARCVRRWLGMPFKQGATLCLLPKMTQNPAYTAAEHRVALIGYITQTGSGVYGYITQSGSGVGGGARTPQKVLICQKSGQIP